MHVRVAATDKAMLCTLKTIELCCGYHHMVHVNVLWEQQPSHHVILISLISDKFDLRVVLSMGWVKVSVWVSAMAHPGLGRPAAGDW